MSSTVVCEGSATVLSDYHICRYDPILGVIVAVGDDCDVVVFGRNLCKRRVPVRRGVHWLDCFLYAGTSSFLLLSSEVLECVNYQNRSTTTSLFADFQGEQRKKKSSCLTCLHVPQGLTCGAVGRRNGVTSYFRFCDTRDKTEELFWTSKETNLLQLVASFIPQKEICGSEKSRLSPQLEALLRGSTRQSDANEGGCVLDIRGVSVSSLKEKDDEEEEVFFPLGSVISVDSFPENPNTFIGVVAGVPGVVEWAVDKGKATTFFSVGNAPFVSVQKNIVVTCKVTPGGQYVVATTSDSSHVFIWKAGGKKKKSSDISVEVYWVVDLSASIGHDLSRNTVEAFQYNEYRIGVYMARASPRNSVRRRKEMANDGASSSTSLSSSVVLTDKTSQLFLLINGQRDILEVVLLLEEKLVVDQEQVITDLNVYTSRKGRASNNGENGEENALTRALPPLHCDPSSQELTSGLSSCSEKLLRSNRSGAFVISSSKPAENFFKVFHVEPCSPRCYWNSELTDIDLDSLIITSSGGLQPMVVKRKQFEQGLQSIQELREISGEAPWCSQALMLHLPQSEREATLWNLAELMTSSIYVSAAQNLSSSLVAPLLPSSVASTVPLTSQGRKESNVRQTPCSALDELVFGGGNLLELYLPHENGRDRNEVSDEFRADESVLHLSGQESYGTTTVGNTTRSSSSLKQRWKQLVSEEVLFATVLGWGSAVLLSPSTSQILRVDKSALQQCLPWSIMADPTSSVVLELALPPASSGFPAEVILRVTAYNDQLLVTKYYIRQHVGRTVFVLDKESWKLPSRNNTLDEGELIGEKSVSSVSESTEKGGGTEHRQEKTLFSEGTMVRFAALVDAKIRLCSCLFTDNRRREDTNSSVSSDVLQTSKLCETSSTSPEFLPSGKSLLLLLEDSSLVFVDVSGEIITGPHIFFFSSSVDGSGWTPMHERDASNTSVGSGPLQLVFPASQFLQVIPSKMKLIVAETFWGSTPTFSEEALHLVGLLEDVRTPDRQLLLFWNLRTMQRHLYSLPFLHSPLVGNVSVAPPISSTPLNGNNERMKAIQQEQRARATSSTNRENSVVTMDREVNYKSCLLLGGTLVDNFPNMTGDVLMFSVVLSVTLPPSGLSSECGEVTLRDAAGGLLFQIHIGFGMSEEASHEWCMRVSPLNEFTNSNQHQHLSQWNALGFPLHVKQIRVNGTLEIPEEREKGDSSYTATTMFWKCVCEEEGKMGEAPDPVWCDKSRKSTTNNRGHHEVLLRGAISHCQSEWPFGNVLLYTQTRDQDIPKRQSLPNTQKSTSSSRYTMLPPCAPILSVVKSQQIISIDVSAFLRRQAEARRIASREDPIAVSETMTFISLEEEMGKTVRSIKLDTSFVSSRWIDDAVISPSLHGILVVTRDMNGWRWIHFLDEFTLASRMAPYPTLDFAGEERIKIFLLHESDASSTREFEREINFASRRKPGGMSDASLSVHLLPSHSEVEDGFPSVNSKIICQLYIVGASTGIIGHYRIVCRAPPDRASVPLASMNDSRDGLIVHSVDSKGMNFSYLQDPFWPSSYQPLPSSFRRYRSFLPRRPTQKAESNFFKRLMSSPWEDVAEQLVNHTFMQVRRGGAEMSTEEKELLEGRKDKSNFQTDSRKEKETDTIASVSTAANISDDEKGLRTSNTSKFPATSTSVSSKIPSILPTTAKKSDANNSSQPYGDAISLTKFSTASSSAVKEKESAPTETRGYRYNQLKAVAQRENVSLTEARRMMGENVRKIQERGERLSAISNKSEQLMSQAFTFQDLARQLKEKQKNSWL